VGDGGPHEAPSGNKLGSMPLAKHVSVAMMYNIDIVQQPDDSVHGCSRRHAEGGTDCQSISEHGVSRKDFTAPPSGNSNILQFNRRKMTLCIRNDLSYPETQVSRSPSTVPAHATGLLAG
jgi:hypothetical protein